MSRLAATSTPISPTVLFLSLAILEKDIREKIRHLLYDATISEKTNRQRFTELTYEKEIPCICSAVNCERYHGLPPVGAIPARLELPIISHAASQTVRYAQHVPSVEHPEHYLRWVDFQREQAPYVRWHSLLHITKPFVYTASDYPTTQAFTTDTADSNPFKDSDLVWQIVGTYDNELAYNKFTVFSFASSLLVPDAAKLFRQTRRVENICKRDAQLLRREDSRIDKIVDALLKGLRSNQQSRNARTQQQLNSGIRQVFSQPCWKGEPFPKGTDRIFVEELHVLNIVPESTKRFLCSIGCGSLLVKSAKETRLMSVATRLLNLKKFLRSLVAVKTKELTENLTIEVLRRSQMDENRINAIYDVVCEKTPVPEAARRRNLGVDSLQRTLWRIKTEVTPQVEAQLSKWMAQDSEAAAVHQELELLKDVQVVTVHEQVSAQNLR